MTNRKQYGRAQALPSCPVGVTETLLEMICNLRPSAKADYLKAQITTKFVSDDTEPSDVRREAAIRKWLATERENEATNTRLLLTLEEYNILPRVSWFRFISFCRDLVRNILGDLPPIEALIGTFSGGASTSRARTCSHPAGKYLGKAHVTPRCAELFIDLIEEMPGWFGVVSDFTPEIVRGNVMFTVPKKTDIDRIACKEPDLNMFVQKGLGSYIRKSLRQVGINLNDQSINQRLAREGSITGRLATLDLSSASDSVSIQLVAEMLPPDWFAMLDSARSPVTFIGDDEHQNEMFSSMGNGFTFELESLLFYVICRAVAYFEGVPGVISVYGDDIICPSEIVDPLTWTLGYLGFSVNSDKSFSTGPFRESCGGHYYNGLDITPFYLKAPIKDLVDVIHAANQIRKWAKIHDDTLILDPEAYAIWSWLKSLVPSDLWGGVDTSFKFQLASPDIPVNRLQEETVKSSTGLGGYVHWLNATWDRQHASLGVETSSKVKRRNVFRRRPAICNTVTRCSTSSMKKLR